MMAAVLPTEARLPEALLTDFRWAAAVPAGGQIRFHIGSDRFVLMQSGHTASLVLAIQRLVTLARMSSVEVLWANDAWHLFSTGPELYPLYSVLLALPRVRHLVATERGEIVLDVQTTRARVLNHRLAKAAGSPSDLALCVEGEGTGVSADLYDLAKLRLHPREYFETMAVEALTTDATVGAAAQRLYDHASMLGTILAELIENSELHGRLDEDGRPFSNTGVRGLLFRRLTLTFPVTRPGKDEPKTRNIKCFEASIFDSGIGYFSSFTGEPLTATTDLKLEWKVLHNCLERHYHPDLADGRPSHRGLGLYEVLRALQALKGRIEVRTGRLYAYRTFLDGELQTQMKPKAQFAHLAWPEPRLLDHDKKYVAVPTEQEQLVGASVRILVPLE